MKLIDLIGKDFEPGKLKVRGPMWGKGYFFVPYFIASNIVVHGKLSDGLHGRYRCDSGDWEFYKEKKAIKYLAYEDKRGTLHRVRDGSSDAIACDGEEEFTRRPEFDIEKEVE